MNIEIVNLDTVKIDGVINGNFTNTCINNSKLSNELHTELTSYFLNLQQNSDKLIEVNTKLDTIKQSFLAGDQDTITQIFTDDARTEKQKIIDDLQAKIDEYQDKISKLQLAEPEVISVDEVAEKL